MRLSHPQGDTSALREAATLLVNAEKPVIIADRAVRSQNGVRLMVELAETLAHGPAAECRKRVFILGPQQVIAALEGHRRARTSRPRLAYRSSYGFDSTTDSRLPTADS